MVPMEIPGFDGRRIHITEMGEGRPLLLLHGLFSNAQVNWVRYGTAKALADAGYRVIMPDLRGHGQSEAPQEADAWPEDVLAKDVEAMLPALDLRADWVLGGFSLGARTVARLLVRGAQPSAAILAGMGLEGLLNAGKRGDWFVRMIQGRGNWPRGTGEYVAEAFMKAHVPQPDGLVHLLSRHQDTDEAELAAIRVPVLVVCGADDRDNGSAPELADLLPNATYTEIPGTHMSSVTRPELARAIIDFLAANG